jgi:CubicO group peptidase (beta-lactamase class C family)
VRVLILWLTLVASAAPAGSQGLPTAAPEAVGFSSSRLQRLDAVMRDYADRDRVSGLVTVVVRNGKVAELAAYGRRDIEANAPMQKDTIFRIASMSKAVTSVDVEGGHRAAGGTR